MKVHHVMDIRCRVIKIVCCGLRVTSWVEVLHGVMQDVISKTLLSVAIFKQLLELTSFCKRKVLLLEIIMVASRVEQVAKAHVKLILLAIRLLTAPAKIIAISRVWSFL